LTWNDALNAAAEGVIAPLAPNIEQRGAVAVALSSGAPLAISPDSWIEGCPRIHHFLPASPEVDVVAYLDPISGDLLAVDVVPVGHDVSFDVAPRRWTEASVSGSVQ
jgi:N-methylhydantoinase B